MRVIDKRMFNPDGELRDEVRQELEDLRRREPQSKSGDSTATPAPETKPDQATAAEPPEEKPDEAEVADTPADRSFAQLVVSLSQYAGLALGMVADPLNPGGAPDLPMARAYIDMLDAISRKTRGNLNPEEKQLLESALYELRMAYGEVSRQAMPRV